jgi:hypothetical protein
MKKTTFYSILLFFTSWISFSQGGAPSCAALEANPNDYQTCASDINFVSSTTPSSENVFPTCFGGNSLAAPSWFIITIENPGAITLQISQIDSDTGQGIDVDFALYGPFTNTTNLCANINNANLEDCSYLPAAVETVQIPSSNTGDIYVLVIDNYGALQGNSGPITVTQTGGTGTTNCNFLSSVEIVEQDNSPITQFEYCKPETKELKALIDITAFSGLPENLRFNYSWFRNNLPIQSTNNSTLATNSISANESGIYKVIITAYDITTNPTGNLAGLRESEATIDLKFHIKPEVSISNSNTVCLDTNPVLTSEISNQADMAPLVDVLNYQWYINNNPINGATNPTFTPTLPGDYYVIVTNAPCSATTSNTIRIIASPNIQIASDNYTL